MDTLLKMDKLKICEVCKPGIIERISDVNAYEPVVTAFQISPDVLRVLPQLKRYA